MFRSRSIRIGKLLGIPIYVHSSWFLIFALITITIASGYADKYSQWTTGQRWAASVLTSLFFFGSVLFHEMAHSVVARHYRIPVVSITLFFFGGVAQISRDPERALQEFNIAAAGPTSSFLLAGAFLGVSALAPEGSMMGALGLWLGGTNAVLALFNLVPGFPLDGGRILRSIVWGITKNYTKASRISARGGQVIAYTMIAFGVWEAVRGWQMEGNASGAIGGIWFVLIGWFLLGAAKQSYAQAETRTVLEGLRASDIMTKEPPSIGREISLEDYARDVSATGRAAHLVIAHGELVGLISTEALARVPREDWCVTSVQAAMTPREKMVWASPEEPALKLLDRMRTVGAQQMPVISEGNVVGMVTRESIVRALQRGDQIPHLTGA
ncbi:MAG: site-2 protease family protein [Candidatus Acidiferrales bacterium]